MRHLMVSAATQAALSRVCPKCQSNQTVPRSRKDEAVNCKKCGATIPPKRSR